MTRLLSFINNPIISNLIKACRAAATQQQTVGNLSAGAGPDDPKVQNAQRQLETKQLAKENAKTAYEVIIGSHLINFTNVYFRTASMNLDT